MGKYLGLLMAGFGVALAVIVGQRMSTDAMAIVVGVAVGVIASVPMSILLVAMLRRMQHDRDALIEQQPRAAMPSYQSAPPNVIVLRPDQLARDAGWKVQEPVTAPSLLPDGGHRGVQVIGEEWR